jgi:hypothetical protein
LDKRIYLYDAGTNVGYERVFWTRAVICLIPVPMLVTREDFGEEHLFV